MWVSGRLFSTSAAVAVGNKNPIDYTIIGYQQWIHRQPTNDIRPYSRAIMEKMFPNTASIRHGNKNRQITFANTIIVIILPTEQRVHFLNN